MRPGTTQCKGMPSFLTENPYIQTPTVLRTSVGSPEPGSLSPLPCCPGLGWVGHSAVLVEYCSYHTQLPLWALLPGTPGRPRGSGIVATVQMTPRPGEARASLSFPVAQQSLGALSVEFSCRSCLWPTPRGPEEQPGLGQHPLPAWSGPHLLLPGTLGKWHTLSTSLVRMLWVPTLM